MSKFFNGSKKSKTEVITNSKKESGKQKTKRSKGGNGKRNEKGPCC